MQHIGIQYGVVALHCTVGLPEVGCHILAVALSDNLAQHHIAVCRVVYLTINPSTATCVYGEFILPFRTVSHTFDIVVHYLQVIRAVTIAVDYVVRHIVLVNNLVEKEYIGIGVQSRSTCG